VSAAWLLVGFALVGWALEWWNRRMWRALSIQASEALTSAADLIHRFEAENTDLRLRLTESQALRAAWRKVAHDLAKATGHPDGLRALDETESQFIARCATERARIKATP